MFFRVTHKLKVQNNVSVLSGAGDGVQRPCHWGASGCSGVRRVQVTQEPRVKGTDKPGAGRYTHLTETSDQENDLFGHALLAAHGFLFYLRNC